MSSSRWPSEVETLIFGSGLDSKSSGVCFIGLTPPLDSVSEPFAQRESLRPSGLRPKPVVVPADVGRIPFTVWVRAQANQLWSTKELAQGLHEPGNGNRLSRAHIEGAGQAPVT